MNDTSLAKISSTMIEDSGQDQKMISQNLRACHRILEVLAESKEEIEFTIDRLPEIFFVIDSEGKILKANVSPIRILNTSESKILGMKISELFEQETKKIFYAKLQQAENLSFDDEEGVNFELPLVIEAKSFDYNWSINKLRTKISGNQSLYTVVGSDITEIRKLERQLSQIFSAVPLGIFIIDQDGFIVGPYSAFTEHIFGTKNFENKSIFDILFHENSDNLSQYQKDGIAELTLCFNEDEMWFQFAQERFPKEIEFERDGKRLFLKTQFHAIALNGKLVNVLVVISDITDAVEMRRKNKIEQSILARRVNYYTAIEKTSEATIQSVLDEFPSFYGKLEDGIKTKDVNLVKFALHSIKSLFRSTGLNEITEKLHNAEMGLDSLDSSEQLHLEFENIKSQIDHDWNEIQGMLSLRVGSVRSKGQFKVEIEEQKVDIIEFVRSLNIDDNLKAAIQKKISRIGYYSFAEMEAFLSDYVEKTAISLKKVAKLHLHQAHCYYSPHLESVLKECFMHIITNVIDHGLPSSAAESEAGEIKVWVEEREEKIFFKIEDNGAGFDLNRIYEKAKKEGLVSSPRDKLSDQEIIDFILRPNFSTKESASIHSGRGVGLSAVDHAIKSHGGEGLKLYNHCEGAGFQFYLDNRLQEN